MKKITKAIIAGTAVTVCGIHAFNKYIEYTSTIRQITKNNFDKYYTWRDTNICYRVKGNGAPVLLIHDLNAETFSYEWNGILDRLSENHKVYVIDLPGCGKSDKPNISYICYYFVELINSFIKDVIRKETTIITSGSAFPIAVMTDHMHKNLINKIIAVNPPAVKTYYEVPNLISRFNKFIFEFPVIGNTIYNLENSLPATKIRLKNKYYINKNNISSLAPDYFYEGAHLSDGNGRFLQASIRGKYTNAYIIDAIKKTNTPIAMIYTPKNKSNILEYKKYTNKIQMFKTDGNEKPHLEYPNIIMETLRVCLPF